MDPCVDLPGVVTTYQPVALPAAGSLAALAKGAIVIADEVHHASEERAWGDSIRIAFGGAARRVPLSGTPFRSDPSPIPFIDCVLDEARRDYVYRRATPCATAGPCAPVYLPRIGGDRE